MTTRSLSLTKFARRPGWAYGLFWSWNAIFFAFMVLGFAPFMLRILIMAAGAGTIPLSFVVYATILTLIPVATVTLATHGAAWRAGPTAGARLRHRRPPDAGSRLALLPRARVDARDGAVAGRGTPGHGNAALAADAPDSAERKAVLLYLRASGLTLLFLAGLYAAVWLVFYAVPLPIFVWQAIRDLIRSFGMFIHDAWTALISQNWASLARLGWGSVPFAVLGAVLAVFSATLFIAMPIAVPISTPAAWWGSQRALAQRYGAARAVALPLTLVIVCGMLLVRANQQPQQAAFALLETPPTSAAEARDLLNHEATIREGLVNAYLAPFRYLSASGDVRHIRQLYQAAFAMPEAQAMAVERLYENVAQPILYEPVHLPSANARPDQRPLVPTGAGSRALSDVLRSLDRRCRAADHRARRPLDVVGGPG